MLRVIGLTRVEIYEFRDAEAGRTFRWNATEGRRLAEARNTQIVAVHLVEAGITRETLQTLAPEVARKRALALPGAALLVPLLFVEHNGKHVCVDGWHRITKAVLQGFPVLPAYVLTQAEADAIRVEDRVESR